MILASQRELGSVLPPIFGTVYEELVLIFFSFWHNSPEEPFGPWLFYVSTVLITTNSNFYY